jgi:hypothetical protein
MPARVIARYAVSTLLLLAVANGAELKEETVRAWDAYTQTVEAHNQERLAPGHRFLWTDETVNRRRNVRAGEIVVAPATAQNPTRVASGLIHHWIGAAFISNMKLNDVLSVVRDYDRYKEYYHPTVIDSKRLRPSGSEDKFSMILMNRALFLKAALDSEYASSFVQVDAQRWYSVAYTTRVQEIEDYDQPAERKLPANEGSGYIWRLYSITRFEERDGGVYVEMEAVALSRDIPVSVRWLVDPIVRRVSKSSLVTSLRQTHDAVTGAVAAMFSPALPVTQGRAIFESDSATFTSRQKLDSFVVPARSNHSK